MDKVKFGVIGAGHIGKRHAEMVVRHPEAELIAMCDTRSAEDCLLPYDVPFFSTPEEMLAQHPEIDVVSVCTPNGLHASHSLLSLAQRKHVVVEKPMALTKLDCERVIYSALNVHKQVFCVMQNRYSPPSVWIKDVLTQNLLGEIYMVNIDCFWNRDDRYYKKSYWKGTTDLDGGTLFTQFSHFIDIMYWLFGDIQNIQARFADFNHGHSTNFEDSGSVFFDFVNGGMGTFNFSTAVHNKNLESTMTIIGAKGTVKIGGQYMNEVIHCDIENYEMPVLPEGNPANDYGDYKGSAANHVYIIENVIDTLKGRNNITTNALEGLKVVDIIERIYLAAPRNIKQVVSAEQTIAK
jgi:UDP-N-acetyl-2-amino-2-deoxyglucuronate dehydrogenase